MLTATNEKKNMDSYLEGLSTRSIATFVAGVRLTARAQRKVTNQQIAEELVTIRDRLGLKSTLVISGKLVSYWGSEKKLISNKIDTETLAAILAYCFQNRLCPENEEGISCLLKVHRVIRGDSALPDYIKKRLTGVGV